MFSPVPLRGVPGIFLPSASSSSPSSPLHPSSLHPLPGPFTLSLPPSAPVLPFLSNCINPFQYPPPSFFLAPPASSSASAISSATFTSSLPAISLPPVSAILGEAVPQPFPAALVPSQQSSFSRVIPREIGVTIKSDSVISAIPGDHFLNFASSSASASSSSSFVAASASASVAGKRQRGPETLVLASLGEEGPVCQVDHLSESEKEKEAKEKEVKEKEVKEKEVNEKAMELVYAGKVKSKAEKKASEIELTRSAGIPGELFERLCTKNIAKSEAEPPNDSEEEYVEIGSETEEVISQQADDLWRKKRKILKALYKHKRALELEDPPEDPSDYPSNVNEGLQDLDRLKLLLNCPPPRKRHRPGTGGLKLPAPGSRNFVCPIPGCGKKFRRNEHALRHEMIHSGEKPFRCEPCAVSFNRSDVLAQHEKTQKHLELALFRGLKSKDISLRDVVEILNPTAEMT